MDKLIELRNKIDELDTKIISLYEERMKVVIEVIQYKIENNIPILDNSREAIMLEKNLNKIKDPKFKKYYKDVLDGYLKASKEMQKDILETSKK
jgi:monofunctional chorismate mutase